MRKKNQRAHTIHCIFFNSKNNCLPCKGQSFLIHFRYVWIRMYCIWLYGGYIASFFFLIHKTIVIVSARKWTAASTYLLSRICTYSVSQQHTNINNWEFYVSLPKNYLTVFRTSLSVTSRSLAASCQLWSQLSHIIWRWSILSSPTIHNTNHIFSESIACEPHLKHFLRLCFQHPTTHKPVVPEVFFQAVAVIRCSLLIARCS